MDIANPTQFFKNFPKLRNAKFHVRSNATLAYNCAAYALDNRAALWWPDQGYKWFAGLPCDDSLQSLMGGFAKVGYEQCADGLLERGFEKVACFANQHGPQHIAKQLGNGWWASKMGGNVDIHHKLGDVECDLYGKPVAFMRRIRNVRRRKRQQRRRKKK